MKKILSLVLIVALLASGLFILTGCQKSGGVDLKLDFSHMNDMKYSAHVNTTADDEVTEFDEDEPNFVRIENEKENYVLDITLDTEAKEAYEEFKTSAKENDVYEETKFGKYEGYYSEDDGIYGYILCDESDPTFNAFVMFNVYLFDEDAENSDIKAIYNSTTIQNILNNIEFKASK